MGMLLLAALQGVLFGFSESLSIGKIVYAGLFFGLMVVWIPAISRNFSQKHDKLLTRTAWLMGLCVFSRISGMLSGISMVDWIRDWSLLIHLSWILVGPLAFISLRSIERIYKWMILISAVLTVLVTREYMTYHLFVGATKVADQIEPTHYFSTTDAISLFGLFLCLPMVRINNYRWMAQFGVIFFITASLLTGTRSLIPAIIAGVAFYLWTTRKESGARNAVGALFCTLLLATGLFLAAGYFGMVNLSVAQNRFEGVTSGYILGGPTRLVESLMALDAFMQHPIIGQGLGYKTHAFGSLWSESLVDNYLIHNFYLYVLAKFGLIGVPVWMAFFIALVKLPVGLYRRIKPPFYKALCAGVAALVVALMVESLAIPEFCDKGTTALLAILICMLLSVERMIPSACGGTPPEAF
jgi:O-antigen ligase